MLRSLSWVIGSLVVVGGLGVVGCGVFDGESCVRRGSWRVSGDGCAPPWQSALGCRAGPVRPACKPRPRASPGQGRVPEYDVVGCGSAGVLFPVVVLYLLVFSITISHKVRHASTSASPWFVPEESKDAAERSGCPEQGRAGRVSALILPRWFVYPACVGYDLLCHLLTDHRAGVGQENHRIIRSPRQGLEARGSP